MAAAFTEKESRAIRSALKDAACKFGNTLGVRKTTVEQLAESADISKGAFYKFYGSKELLFFEVMEDSHKALYDAVWKAWESNPQLPAPQRAAETVLAIMRIMNSGKVFGLHEDDSTYILRKIPQDVLDQHFESDEEQETRFIKRMGLRLKCTLPECLAVFRSLMTAFYHRKELGSCYPKALRILTEGACEKIVEP